MGCMEMGFARTSAGESYSPFWTDTGQASSPEVAVGWPKPGPWCICMWAFARMLQRHPTFIDLLHCDATNQWVIENYQLNVPSQSAALYAICNKCGIEQDDSTPTHLKEKCRAV